MNGNNSESVARADPGFRALGLRHSPKIEFRLKPFIVIRLIENDCKRKQVPRLLVDNENWQWQSSN